jgi:hypothetical protein
VRRSRKGSGWVGRTERKLGATRTTHTHAAVPTRPECGHPRARPHAPSTGCARQVGWEGVRAVCGWKAHSVDLGEKGVDDSDGIRRLVPAQGPLARCRQALHLPPLQVNPGVRSRVRSALCGQQWQCNRIGWHRITARHQHITSRRGATARGPQVQSHEAGYYVRVNSPRR